ncbi:formylglycine-generating enzyme family protein [Candidatus Zixiibacteriota bacterium]
MKIIKSYSKVIIMTFFFFSYVLLLTFWGCNGNSDKANEKLDSSIIQLSRGDMLTNSFGMKLVYIPAGEFMMGSRETPKEVVQTEGGKVEWYLREHPIHHVEITNGFYMGITEITQEQYQAVLNENPSKYRGNHLPVENVTWKDAVRFCEVLSKIEKKTFRLPTEAEWEYACRAGADTRFAFGDDYDAVHKHMNYCDSSNTCGYWWQDREHDDGFDRTSPVKNFEPNAFGLYDMHGNVWEYCSDWYDHDYYASSPEVDPKGPPSGQYRVLRGGSWHDGPAYCRAAFRNRNEPDYTCDDNGFRIALETSH